MAQSLRNDRKLEVGQQAHDRESDGAPSSITGDATKLAWTIRSYPSRSINPKLEYIYYAALAALLVLGDFLYYILISNLVSGTFSLSRTFEDEVLIKSRCGEFRIDAHRDTIHYHVRSSRGFVNISSITALSCTSEEFDPLFFLNLPGNLFIYQGKINDQSFEWIAARLLAEDGMEIPIFIGGRYKRSNPLFDWYFDIQENIAQALNITKDLDRQGAEVTSTLATLIPQAKLIG